MSGRGTCRPTSGHQALPIAQKWRVPGGTPLDIPTGLRYDRRGAASPVITF
jgi:hypothetical protein